MSTTIAQLISQLRPDTWRQERGFSADFSPVQEALFNPSLSDEQTVGILSTWIQKSQPCLFGRIADRLGLIQYCVLRERELASDEATKSKIQSARLEWTRAGFRGRKNGFVILAICEKLATSVPDGTMKKIALRLCSHYLETEICPDTVYTDELFLEITDDEKSTWRWPAGVNYFSATGDQRWWHDHRIPGGMGFSTNSVGHMVKSGKFNNLLHAMQEELGILEKGSPPLKIDSLQVALELAMRTISNAANTISGKATALTPLPPDTAHLPASKCPASLPAGLVDKNYCEYEGYYHTDETVPSEYFDSSVERPTGTVKRTLDFTYLFLESIDNPAFNTMGEGKRIRFDPMDSSKARLKERRGKELKVLVKNSPLLKRALGL